MKETRMEGLRQALKMEEDGKAFYSKALSNVSNRLAKDIFKSLIKAEEKHVKRIGELYTSLEKTGDWPKVILTREREGPKDNIFATALSALSEKTKGTTTDIEALKFAAKLEDEGIKYYQSKATGTEDPFEKKFFQLLAREEGEHLISLLDTIEYLEDPQGYFSQLERGTLSF